MIRQQYSQTCTVVIRDTHTCYDPIEFTRVVYRPCRAEQRSVLLRLIPVHTHEIYTLAYDLLVD
jgi:hypothetical protein